MFELLCHLQHTLYYTTDNGPRVVSMYIYIRPNAFDIQVANSVNVFFIKFTALQKQKKAYKRFLLSITQYETVPRFTEAGRC